MQLLIFLLLACCSLSSQAGVFYYGNELYDRMRTSSDNPLRAAGMGFIVGVHDLGVGIAWCTPSGVSIGQVFDLVRKDLEANPETRHRPASELVSNILSKTFPCPGK